MDSFEGRPIREESSRIERAGKAKTLGRRNQRL